MRAHAVLLSDAGFSLKQLSVIFNVCRQTVSAWLRHWEEGGSDALSDKPRSGRPPKVTGGARQYVLGQVTESPRPLNTVLAQLAEKWGVPVSIASLRRLCKKAGLVWKRVRKSLKSKRDAERFAQAQQQLAGLSEQAGWQEIGLAYFDESGFTLEPCVPYAWQPVGETVEAPCDKS